MCLKYFYKCVCGQLEINPLASEHEAATDRREFCYQIHSWAARGSRHSLRDHCSACSSSQRPRHPVEHLLAGESIGHFRQPGCTCLLAFFRMVSLASLYFREASRDLLMRTHSLMDFSFIQLPVLNTQNEALKEFVLCVPSTHHKPLLSGRVNTWKMLSWPHTLNHLSTPRCVHMYTHRRAP